MLGEGAGNVAAAFMEARKNTEAAHRQRMKEGGAAAAKQLQMEEATQRNTEVCSRMSGQQGRMEVVRATGRGVPHDGGVRGSLKPMQHPSLNQKMTTNYFP